MYAQPCSEWIRLPVALWLLLASTQGYAMTYEQCRAIVVQGYISRCEVSIGNCSLSQCSTTASCSRGNNRCEKYLSGSTWVATGRQTHYCASV